MTGHLLGAAGVLEAIFSILAIRDQVAPPTINLENPDEGCDLDYIPGTARQRKIDVIASNSFGFGGTNGTLVFPAPWQRPTAPSQCPKVAAREATGGAGIGLRRVAAPAGLSRSAG